MMIKKRFTALIALGLTTLAAAFAQTPKLTPDNIDAVVAAMTLEEKATLLVGGGNTASYNDGPLLGNQKKFVAGAAGVTRPIERLGIPPTVFTDGPAGVHIDATRNGTDRTYYATSFPIGTALACTWNTQLVESVGQAIGNEVLEYGCDVILGPGMNIHRSPLCGRNFEYYSEDPVLSGKIGAAWIRGVQSQGVGACPKHFAVNSQETDRTKVDEIVSQRALREIYLRDFEIAVREAKPWTIMSSYNRINGPLAQESRDLLTNILRTDWQWNGMVMTDWIGKRNTAAQVHAGNDLMEPGRQTQIDEIIACVNNGTLAIEDVDICVKRVLEMVVKSPRFRTYGYSENPDLTAHARITRESATEGMVLLKNDGNTLPMNVKRVALFGVNSYDFLACGFGSGFVNAPFVTDMVTGLNNAGITTSTELTDIYQAYIPFAKKKFIADKDPMLWFFDQGQPKVDEIEISDRCIEKAAADSEIAIITLGRMSGEDIDREIDGDFNLTELERNMIGRVADIFHAHGKRVVVVLNVGGVIETQSWRDRVDAILVSWQSGEEGGNSVTDVLAGKANPSGKLAMTWPVAIGDVPSTANFPQETLSQYNIRTLLKRGTPIKGNDFTVHEEDIYVGYRYFDTFDRAVSYPFGFGLSYTTFALSQTAASVKGDKVEVKVTVKNTGNVAGKEVAQVYVTAPDGNVEKPSKELKAFAKTRLLNPGESQTLTMTIDRRDLTSFDEQHSQWLGEAGTYTLHVGTSVADIKGTATVKLAEYTEPVTNSLVPQQEINRLKKN